MLETTKNVMQRKGSSGSALADADEAIMAIRRGEMIIMMDDEDRENEGDLIVAADFATPEMINFMITHGRGLVCVAITAERSRQLNLPAMVPHNQDHHGTAFTVSVDGAPEHGVTTGISAYDRARTINLLLHGTDRDLRRPGHIFPLVARDGGVSERNGHTEASVDLARLAGLSPAAVIVEIIRKDGAMARRPDLELFALEHGLVISTIHRLQQHLVRAGSNRE